MKKHILYLLLTISSFCYSQETTSFDYYLSQGFKFHDNRKLDSCLYFLQKTDSIVKLIPKDSSKFYQKEILEATYFIRKNKIDQSIEKLFKANLFFKKIKDSANISFTLHKLGVANYYANRRLISGEYFNKVLQFKKHTPKKELTRIYQNLGTINLEVGMLEKNDSLKQEAIKSYKNAIKIFKQENWLLDQTLATSLLAECYNQLGDYNKALKIINEAIILAKKGNNQSQLGFALIKKTSFLGNKKKYSEALRVIKIAKPIFKELEDYPTFLYALNEEKKILVGLKRYKEATIVGDSIFQTSIKSYDLRFTDKVAEMDAKYKTAEIQKEIALHKEEILGNKLKIKNRRLFTTILGAAFLILIILSTGYFHRSQYIKKQLQKEIDLKDALSTIKTQNRLQEQRLNISRDLHDNIGSQLTFIISSIDNLKYVSKDVNDKLKDKLSSISSFTTDTIFQFRDTIWAMNKSEISLEDLQTRVLSFVEKAKQATGNSINFKFNSNVTSNAKFSSIIGMNLFRVIQESINNSIKYANPSIIKINTEEKDKQLIITIEDNGGGFELDKVSLGNGLKNIESRMSDINGEAFITSSPNSGTTVKVKLPFKYTTNDV